MHARREYLARQLALAAGSLLAGSPVLAGTDGNTQLDIAVLHWDEAGRVSAREPVLSLRHELENDRAFTIGMVYDALSGASHNGAGVQPAPQTFSAASGGAAADPGGYTVPAGAVPLDPGFEDERQAFNASFETPLGNPLWKAVVGANYSSESDFVSSGGSATLSRDFNRRNTTLTAGISVESDRIRPAAGTPLPFAVRPSGGAGGGEDGGGGEDEEEGGGEDGGGAAAAPVGPMASRKAVDAMIGLTQVIDRATLVQFNVAVSQSTGYMNDPYKIVTVSGSPLSYVFENRPDSRAKKSFYAGLKHAFGNGDIVDLGYRRMTDDWGIASDTVDLYYRIALPAGWYLEPHLRGYRQDAADFFVMSLPASAVPAPGTTNRFASGDYRLGALVDTTAGARIGVKTDGAGEYFVRFEKFSQRGDWAPANMDATILEFGGSWRF